MVDKELLDVHNLSFSYTKNKPVIEDINFSLSGGELLGLLGANGAGKSTLFRCVLGFEKTYTGEIFINGEHSENNQPACRGRSQMKTEERAKLAAYVPQIHFPSFNYSVFDMILMGTTTQGREWSVPKDSQIKNAMAAMDQIGIADLKERDFRLISGGEQQLVLIARALAQIAPLQNTHLQKSSLLVMDEPASYLDYGNQLRVLYTIKNLSKQGYGILLSTHNPDHAFLFADRIIALHDKHIAASGTPCECLTAELIKKLYNVNVVIHCDEHGMHSCVPTRVAPTESHEH
jgi:iron complex transport system ATP-binding protein